MRRLSPPRSTLVKHCRFKNSFIFKYSPRPGTTAIDRFKDDVPEDVKKKRNNDLLAVQQEVCAENNRQMIGKTVQVMVEGQSKLANKPAYPSSPHGVELGWEKRRAELATLAEILSSSSTPSDARAGIRSWRLTEISR